MENISLGLRDELIEKLNGFIDHTEKIYLSLANRFPKLLGEMDRSIQRSTELLDSVHESASSSEGFNSQIGRVLARTRSVIEEGSKTFGSIHSEDEELFTELDAGIERLSALEDLIGRIKEDSIEMELISLNAMTVALKAGTAGKAFSYITEELQRLSTRTINLTDDITKRGSHLLEVFYRFRNSVEEVKEFQTNLFSDFKTRLEGSFEEFNKGVSQVILVLSSMSEKSTQIKAPLHRIMEEIQLQDIIKQSVDHVIISLSEFDDVEESESEELFLDELAFFKSIPDLCTLLLNDVKQNIQQSLDVFKDNASEAEELLNTVEKERLDFLSSSMVSGSGSGKSLNDLFEESSSMLASLLEDVENSIVKKQGITNTSQELMKDVYQLEDNFKSFSTMVNRFHSIDVASRIEVAKQDVLQQMSGTVEEMTALTTRIEDDVDTSLQATKEFISTTNHTVTEFRSVNSKEELFVKDFAKKIKQEYEELFAAKNELTESISNFSLFTNQFFRLFETTRDELSGLEVLVEDIDDINDKLSEIRRQTSLRMQPLLEARGLSEWRIENEKLKNIIKRFTIFTHKKTAGEIGGFNVEEGVESGEVTLF